MSNGRVSVRVRRFPQKTSIPNDENALSSETKRIVVETASLPKYCEIDTLLRAFQHSRALDIALAVR